MKKLIFILAVILTFFACVNEYKKSEGRENTISNVKTDSEKSQLQVSIVKNSAEAFTDLRPLMDQYCFSCHNDKKTKGKFNLKDLRFDHSDQKNMLAWQEVVDQLSTSDMPPEDEPSPTDKERQRLIEVIQAKINANKPKPNQTVLRRLNRQEYENTIRDLFQMRIEDFHGAVEFPSDERMHGFTNNGEALVTSSFHLDHYMDAANAVIERVLPVETKKPKVKAMVFKPPFTKNRRDLSSWYYGKNKFQDHVQNETGLRLIYLHAEKFRKGVPHRGYYKIRLMVEGKNRTKKHPEYDRLDNPSFLKNKKEKLSVTIYAGSESSGELSRSTQEDKFLGEFELPDDQPHMVELTAWLEKGQSLKFGFPQGIDKVKKARNILKSPIKKRPDFLKNVNVKAFVKKYNASSSGGDWAAYMEAHSKIYPTLRFYNFEVEGPFYEEWPHRPVTNLLNGKSYTQVNLQETITQLAGKAFRRPVKSDEISAILAYVERTYDQSGSKREALANGIRAILCSPQFYYVYENEGELDNYAIASRLSYFLWSSMPDARLFDLAEQGELKDKEVLVAEVDRMLKDSKAKSISKNLAEQWLGLYKLGAMPPSVDKEPEYYRRKLKLHSKYETYELLDYILMENRPFMEILTADYTFLNRGLADFYELENYYKYPVHEYIKTPLKDKRRKGIFGHMGLLTATSNGVDTSPIIRGVWVYETLMGKHAPLPPDSVPAIEPDIRNAKTIRDQLKKHRESKDCKVCHLKFDHFGFALENFDALGRWRNEYIEKTGKGRTAKVNKLPVESYGKMTSGEVFDDINGMRKILSSKQEMFANTVVSKLLTLAIGREINSFDREEVNQIIAKTHARGNGMKNMLKEVVKSKIFMSK